MVDTRADILSLDQAVDFKKAKEAVGKEVCLMGNMDPSRLYCGEPSEIEGLSKTCIKDAGEEGGFILASGCEIPPDCPPENLRMLIHVARTYGMCGGVNLSKVFFPSFFLSFYNIYSFMAAAKIVKE